VAATAHPGDFSGRGVVAAKAAGGSYHAPAMSPKQARASGPAENRSTGNRPADNRAVNHPVQNRASSSNGSKAAYRPPTSPSRSNTSDRHPSPNRTQTNSRMSSNQPAESHTKTSSPQPGSHTSNTPRRESAPRAQNVRPSIESRPPSGQAARAYHESRPQSAPRPAPQARQSAPRPASQAREPATAPRPQRQSAPPRRDNPPKAERKQG
jgi:hypothetical protein